MQDHKKILKMRNRMRLTVRLLATAAVLFQRFYFGPIGAGGGLVDGLILTAIWITREPDSE